MLFANCSEFYLCESTSAYLFGITLGMFPLPEIIFLSLSICEGHSYPHFPPEAFPDLAQGRVHPVFCTTSGLNKGFCCFVCHTVFQWFPYILLLSTLQVPWNFPEDRDCALLCLGHVCEHTALGQYIARGKESGPGPKRGGDKEPSTSQKTGKAVVREVQRIPAETNVPKQTREFQGEIIPQVKCCWKCK